MAARAYGEGMIRAYALYSDGRALKGLDREGIAQAVKDPAARVWVDLEVPSEEEVRILSDVFAFHPLAIEDSVKYSQRPKIEQYRRENGEVYYYMVFHGPDVETFREHLRTKEIDLFFGERYLVTYHDEPMRSVVALAEKADADPKVVLGPGVDMLLYGLLDRIVDFYEPILDYLDETLDRIEEQAAECPTRQVLTQISAKKRELLELRRSVGPQREMMAQLTRGEVELIREPTRVYFRDVQDHLIHIVETVDLYRDLILGARDIYLSSISNQLNQIMKTLTILSVIALPLTVITGFFGMNFESIPGLHSRGAFWVTVGVMVVAVTGMLIVFQKKKWL